MKPNWSSIGVVRVATRELVGSVGFGETEDGVTRIQFSYFKEQISIVTTVVTFRGNYWEENKKPRSNNEPLIRYVIAQAVMWPPSPGRGIVVDLSGLEYTYGDELLSWVSLLRWRLLRNQDYKLALVWGEKNKDAIKSLMEDADETELLKTSFDRLEDAISYICD